MNIIVYKNIEAEILICQTLKNDPLAKILKRT